MWILLFSQKNTHNTFVSSFFSSQTFSFSVFSSLFVSCCPVFLFLPFLFTFLSFLLLRRQYHSLLHSFFSMSHIFSFFSSTSSPPALITYWVQFFNYTLGWIHSLTLSLWNTTYVRVLSMWQYCVCLWSYSGSMRSVKWWQGFVSISTWCWAHSCCTSSRGRSTPRSWRSNRTCPCHRFTELHTCCVSLVGALDTHTQTHNAHQDTDNSQDNHVKYEQIWWCEDRNKTERNVLWDFL